MKAMKKILALVIGMIMVMGITAMATQSSGYSITVTNSFDGQTYKLYKLFDATVAEGRTPEGEGITYTVPAGKTLAENNWFEVNDYGYVVAKENADITTDAFKTWAVSFGEKNATELTGNGGSISWTGLDDGYYYIATTTGSLVTVTSISPSASVIDKNEVPTITKTVQEDSVLTDASSQNGDGVTEYNKKDDVEIGETVYYKTVIAAKKGASGYVLYDKMDVGLTFNTNSIRVYKDSVTESNLVEMNGNYTVATSGKYMKPGENEPVEDGDAAFILTFTKDFADSITAPTNVIVLYTATLNSNAAVATAELNTTILHYGSDANTFTNEEQTKTYTWGIEIEKEDGKTKTKKLAGAQFVIYRLNAAGKAEYAKFTSGKLTGWTVADTTAVADLPKQAVDHFSDATTVLTTGTDGLINVAGLDEGTYYALEIKAPDGYNKLTAAEEIVIDSDSDTDARKTIDADLSSGTSGVTKETIDNNKGGTLPSTGGMGTTIFYIIGAILVIGAGILLVSKKRMSAN